MPVIEEYLLTGKVAMVVTWTDPFTPYLAEALAEAGAKVFVAARRQAPIEDSVQRVTELGEEAHGTLCDATTETDVDNALAAALDHFGRVDILVNNFRVEFAKPFGEVELVEFEQVMRRNVKSVFLTCQAVGKVMIEQGGGRIINITCGLAERGLWNSVVYCASQGAVLQLTRALALEWGRHDVRVNAIGTGWFSTEEPPPEEAQKELLVRYIPLRRRGHPRDIGPLLVYLASDSCDYTTGQPIYVDGGLMAHP